MTLSRLLMISCPRGGPLRAQGILGNAPLRLLHKRGRGNNCEHRISSVYCFKIFFLQNKTSRDFHQWVSLSWSCLL